MWILDFLSIPPLLFFADRQILKVHIIVYPKIPISENPQRERVSFSGPSSTRRDSQTF